MSSWTIDTGIKLNGFPDGQTDTKTITGTLDPGKAAQILAQLKQDDQPKATIKYADADDLDSPTTAGSNNQVTLPTGNTTLAIAGRAKKYQVEGDSWRSSPATAADPEKGQGI